MGTLLLALAKSIYYIYTMVAKKTKNVTTLSLQRCFVSCYTHSSGDFNGKNIQQQAIYIIRVVPRVLLVVT